MAAIEAGPWSAPTDDYSLIYWWDWVKDGTTKHQVLRNINYN